MPPTNLLRNKKRSLILIQHLIAIKTIQKTDCKPNVNLIVIVTNHLITSKQFQKLTSNHIINLMKQTLTSTPGRKKTVMLLGRCVCNVRALDIAADSVVSFLAPDFFRSTSFGETGGGWPFEDTLLRRQYVGAM